MIKLTCDRDAEGGLTVSAQVRGNTDELLDDLAMAAAHLIVDLIDDLRAQDQSLYGMAARMTGVEIERRVEFIHGEREARRAQGY